MRKIFTVGAAVLLSVNLLAQNLTGVESVEYDPINNRYLASSDNNSIVAIAPNGGLSYFGTSTVASYGMEVMNGTLFAIHGSTIKGYDLVSAAEVMSVTISGAQFLNGMGSNGVDKLWVSDFGAKKIYQVDIPTLANASFSAIVNNTVTTPNGIVYDADNNRILFGNWETSNATIKAVNLSNNMVSTVTTTGVGKIDGIDSDSDGNWYISSWTPARITKYNNDFSTSEVITVPGINSPADICYVPETDTLAIPGGNQVLFVGFESPSVGIEEENFENHRVFYNSGHPVVQFELSAGQDVNFEVIDMNGRLVYTVLEGLQPTGKHSVVLSSIGLYSGAYFCRLTSKELSFTERIVIP